MIKKYQWFLDFECAAILSIFRSGRFKITANNRDTFDSACQLKSITIISSIQEKLHIELCLHVPILHAT